MVFQLNDNPFIFPDPHYGEEDGLLAVGGDLSPQRLLTAYSNGIFPWFGFREREEIMWWCPLRRFVIFPHEVHISHSMRQLLKKGIYYYTTNKAFSQVIENCSKVNDRINQRGAWLGEDMINAYTELHKLGFAHSVEIWDKDNNLVGGLYGVTIRNVFIGESMFSKVPNGSKLALIALGQNLPSDCIIDCQLETDHLKSMGGQYISYEEYLKYLIPNEKQESNEE